MPTTFRTIATEAAQEIGAVALGDPLPAADAMTMLGKIQRLLNNWNADRRAVYATSFDTYTLVPNLSPHTIGPTGATFTATIRPVSLDGVNLILSDGGTPTNLTITVRDNQWWLAQTIPTIATTVPTDVYYQPDWPNGKLYFWPVPQTAYQVQLMTRVLLNDVPDLDTAFSLPPGYHDAIVLTTAEESFSVFWGPTSQPPPLIMQKAREARSRIFDNNDQDPRLKTRDSGMESLSGRRGDFNFWSGQVI
ncbi:MAG TPA: hypothetical protein VF456_20420 [Vicinamibacterales bacterium]